MTTQKKRFVTKEGLEKLQEEVQELKNNKRKEIAERIHEAKELGDLSENAEYIEAKEEQGFIEARIIELETIIKNSQIIAYKKNANTVQIGSTVQLKNLNGDVVTFTIVGSSEANPAKQRISNESPIGKGLLEKKIGEKVTIETPQGPMEYELPEIE